MDHRPASTRTQRLLIWLGTFAVIGLISGTSWLMINGTLPVSIFGRGSIPAADQCPSGTQQPVVPERVRISVFNTTNAPGLAHQVADELSLRGFRVAEVDNDYFADTGFAGIIRVGDRGLRQAYTLQQHIPGSMVDLDDRGDFSVDLILGSDFEVQDMEEAEDLDLVPGLLRCSAD
ncbi:LytR C-terminal domain-containing protein [Nesterenkonia sp. E16_7]|uniref:LytR C-terminal domain-containing protein n=1 Tax=unclassified Nesterenkonia TaxID=2629769 RepID=UPI001A9233B3|nr:MULTISPECIES: LytR C-terminal domain-containing protein [unclassified Nesterenkonia]MBO0594084.1 LytR C-terminal domain-containing protein [Nesterenkonia sp. E16_10]MBO0597530.1 LytR C-terminal domain-containing protein [Nesterenkonia sp. E16_7]